MHLRIAPKRRGGIDDVIPRRTYYYYLTAKSASGVPSRSSPVVSATPTTDLGHDGGCRPGAGAACLPGLLALAAMTLLAVRGRRP